MGWLSNISLSRLLCRFICGTTAMAPDDNNQAVGDVKVPAGEADETAKRKKLKKSAEKQGVRQWRLLGSLC